MTSSEIEVLTKPQMKKIEGEVWCDEHGTVHEDSTDPYRTGAKDCSKTNHRPIYVRRRKGDFKE